MMDSDFDYDQFVKDVAKVVPQHAINTAYISRLVDFALAKDYLDVQACKNLYYAYMVFSGQLGESKNE